MAVNDLGIVRPGSTILIPFATFDSNDPSASVAIAALVLADIGIYKGTSMTERASTTGVVLLDTTGVDIDGAVGIGGLSIDLSSNATAGFYEAGQQYYVTVGPVTVDSAVINFVGATFRIGYPGAIHETSILVFTSTDNFTLTVGSADDNAYNGWLCLAHDVASAIQVQIGIVEDYTGSSKTINLKADPGVFVMTAADNISLFPPALNAVIPGAMLDVTPTGAAGIDWNNIENKGATVNFTSTLLANVGIVAIAELVDEVDLVNALAADTITSTAIQDGAITAAKITALNSTAWGNLDDQYDTTGIAGGNFPATQAQVGNIGTSGGGARAKEMSTDNSVTNTIDNAVAVDLGGGLVGIPVTGHAFIPPTGVPIEVTIAGSAEGVYNNSFKVESQTTNQVVITVAYAAITFTGSETILASVKGITSVGSQAGTFVNTESLDGNFHVLTNAGDNLDWVYKSKLGGDLIAGQIEIHAYLTSNNDTVNIQLYDFIGDDWETQFVLQGTSQATLQTEIFTVLSKHTGTSGDDLGFTFIRVVDAAAAGHVLGIEKLVVIASPIAKSVGYANGRIYVDTLKGKAGTEKDVNGVADNAVLTWADALLISAKFPVPITDFHIVNGSTIVLSATSDNYSLFGDNWILDLNGQQIAGAHFEGANVSGTSTGAAPSFIKGEISAITLGNDAHIDEVSLIGPFTLVAGDIHIDDCHHAGSSAVVMDFGAAVGGTTVHMHGYEGNVETQNMGDDGTDILHLDGDGTLLCNSNGAGGTVHLRGNWKHTANNATVNFDDTTAEVTAVKVVTDAQAQAASTIIDGTASGTPGTTSMVSDIGVTVDDQYKGRIITFAPATTTAALRNQSTDITAATASSNTLTFTALTTAPVSGDTFSIT